MKKKIWIFAVVAVIAAAAVVLCFLNAPDSVALRNGKTAYDKYMNSPEGNMLDTKNFLFAQDENHIVAIRDGVVSETVYPTKREALQ